MVELLKIGFEEVEVEDEARAAAGVRLLRPAGG
jgi:hypothetical protein